jgi:putative phosphoesterase
MKERIGLISDTHGLLRPEALAYLRGCSRIIHGGDIGGPELLESLAALAPVTAVRGNNDSGLPSGHLNPSEIIRVQDVLVYAIHDRADLDVDPRSRGIGVVVCGHSHQPSIERCDDVLFVNPGSAGPRRFKLPIALGELWVDGTEVTAQIFTIEVAPVARAKPRRSG